MMDALKLNYLRALVTNRLKNMEERGASAVEYGLLVAGIAVVIIAGVFFLGGKVKSLFTDTGDKIGHCDVTGTTGSTAACS